jgi:pimeloyl-ACP methyl ester carboxylesterase
MDDSRQTRHSRGGGITMRIAATLTLLALLFATAAAQDTEPADTKLTAEEVKITVPAVEADGETIPAWEIAGTLNLPKGDAPEAGWPAVFFISGSGSQNRHGKQGGMDLGTTEVLDAVANAGFAVLRVDDRGTGDTPVGPKGIDPTTIGYTELVSDARHCVNWLRAHAKVNKEKVFVIGHSEGGVTAPILGGEGLCAGVVCMAGIGRNMYDVIYEQVEDANKRAPKERRESTMKLQKELQDAAKDGREPDYAILGEAFAPQVKKIWNQQMKPALAWFHDHFNLDVPAIHAKVKCPAFVAQGEADFQVKADADGRLLAKNLLAGECTDVTFKLYADLDHLFKPCKGRKSSIEMYKEDRRVSEAFLKDLVAWLQARS